MNGYTSDRREAILARMEEILQVTPSVVGVWRDRGVLPRLSTPAIILLDGEERRLTARRAGDGVQMPAGEFQIRTQVAIVLPPRDTVQNTTLGGAALPIGPALSAYRVLIVAAILEDQNLINLCTAISYEGYSTDFKTGDEIGAFGPFMVFMFWLSYMLDASALVTPASITAAQAEIAARYAA